MTDALVMVAFIAAIGVLLMAAAHPWRSHAPHRCTTCGHALLLHQGCAGQIGCAAGCCGPTRCTCPGYQGTYPPNYPGT